MRDALAESDADCVKLALGVRDAVTDTLLLRLAVALPLMVALPDTERVGVSVPRDTDLLCVIDSDALSDRVVVAVAVRVAVAVALPLAVLLAERVLLADGEMLGVCERLPVRVPLTLPLLLPLALIVTLAVSVRLRDTLRLGDADTDPLTERVRVVDRDGVRRGVAVCVIV